MGTKSNIKNTNPRRRLLNLAVLVALGGGALAPAPASAAALYWVCGSAQWFMGCWSTSVGGTPNALPQNRDNVYLNQTDAVNRTVTYNGGYNPAWTLSGLSINATGTGMMTFSQTDAPLAVGHEYIGNTGKGAYNQSGGTNAVGGSLNIGFNSGSNGSYSLSGTGSLSAYYEYIGYGGTGVFNQSGGTNTVNQDLTLASGSSSNGSYNLSAGSLSTSMYEIIGSGGTGVFNQSGGTNTVGYYLYLGHYSSSNGSYNLSAGGLSVWHEVIGVSGTGTFNQSGGTNTVSYLNLASNSGSNGTYNLNGGTLNVGRITDGAGLSVFNLDGGSLNLTGGSIALDVFNIGRASSSNGSFTLGNGKTLSAGNETIGYAGTGALTQNGGTHTVGSQLYLGAFFGSNGSYNLSAGGLSASSEVIGSEGTGAFTQNGGTNTVSSNLYLGYWSSGSYNLNAGSLSSNNEVVGMSGTGTFTQSGGTNTVGSALYLGMNSGSHGAYNLSAGNLSASSEIIGHNGTGAFTQSGGTHTVTGTMTLAANTYSSGTYNLTGGALTVNGGITNNVGGSFNVGAGATATVGGSGFVNHGLLGGAGTIAGNVTSDGAVGPGNSPGMLSITGNYTQTMLGIYAVEIGGLLAGTQYDALNVTGTATLNGLLNVSLFDLGGGLFAPHAGDYFDILTASTITGSFGSLSFAALSDPNLFWQINYLTDAIGSTDVVRLSIGQNIAPVTPVPEPETWAMLLAGLGLLGFAGRRRNGVSRQAI